MPTGDILNKSSAMDYSFLGAPCCSWMLLAHLAPGIPFAPSCNPSLSLQPGRADLTLTLPYDNATCWLYGRNRSFSLQSSYLNIVHLPIQTLHVNQRLHLSPGWQITHFSLRSTLVKPAAEDPNFHIYGLSTLTPSLGGLNLKLHAITPSARP